LCLLIAATQLCGAVPGPMQKLLLLKSREPRRIRLAHQRTTDRAGSGPSCGDSLPLNISLGRYRRFSPHSGHAAIMPFADTLISGRGQFWWTAQHTDQKGLFQSYIVLSEGFYRHVMQTCVPLDMLPYGR
jgi:Plasmid encoded RepA protein